MKRPDAALQVLLVVGLAGLAIRYHDIGGQVLLDDEWHSLRHVANVPLWTACTTYFKQATSIPINAYTRALLDYWGWSELPLRLPSIIATVATAVLLPFVVLRAFENKLVAIVVAVLFAASEFWVFYGESSRPYAEFLLFLVLAFHFLSQAERTGKTSDYLRFGLVGAAAVYFHVFALPVMAALSVVTAARVVLSTKEDHAGLLSRAKGPLLGFGALGVVLLSLYGPALARGMEHSLPSGDDKTPYGGRFLPHLGELVSGARSPAVAYVLLALAALGLVSAYRRNARFVSLIGAGLAGSLAMMFASKTHEFRLAIVMTRYNITVFLLYFVGLACFVDEVAKRAAGALERRGASGGARHAPALVASVFAALYVAATPIPAYLAIHPCNFRLHSAFQEYYDEFSLTAPPRSEFSGRTLDMTADSIPPFYRSLPQGRPCRLIEYPMEIEDAYIPFYFYQLHHHCDVTVGYSANDDSVERLDVRKNGARLHFRNMVAVDELAPLRAANADYVVVHLDNRSEIRRRKHTPWIGFETRRILLFLVAAFGQPVYEDNWIMAFRPR